MNDERAFILDEVKRLYQQNGRSPGIAVFVKTTGIPSHRIIGVHWARWSDVLSEAGLSSNQLTQKFSSQDLLRGLAAFTRSLGKYPSQSDIKLGKRQGQNLANPDVYPDHLGGAVGVRKSLWRFCEDNPEYADVQHLIPIDDAAERPPANVQYGYVYLLQSGEHFKIGRSENLERRIKEIGVALPTSVSLIHAITTDDPAGIEAYWHRRFADRRANGEWFKLSREDLAAFRRRKFQ